jgi:hypothetical protein
MPSNEPRRRPRPFDPENDSPWLYMMHLGDLLSGGDLDTKEALDIAVVVTRMCQAIAADESYFAGSTQEEFKLAALSMTTFALGLMRALGHGEAHDTPPAGNVFAFPLLPAELGPPDGAA